MKEFFTLFYYTLLRRAARFCDARRETVYGARCVWRGETVFTARVVFGAGKLFCDACCVWRGETVLRCVLCLLPLLRRTALFRRAGKLFPLPDCSFPPLQRNQRLKNFQRRKRGAPSTRPRFDRNNSARAPLGARAVFRLILSGRHSVNVEFSVRVERFPLVKRGKFRNGHLVRGHGYRLRFGEFFLILSALNSSGKGDLIPHL